MAAVLSTESISPRQGCQTPQNSTVSKDTALNETQRERRLLSKADQ